MSKWTSKIDAASCAVSDYIGSKYSFPIATLFIVLWGLSGFLFTFSDTWQLVINTTTNVITFLMVFLIERSQNRDTQLSQEDFEEIKDLLKQRKEPIKTPRVVHVDSKEKARVALHLSLKEAQIAHHQHELEWEREHPGEPLPEPWELWYAEWITNKLFNQ